MLNADVVRAVIDLMIDSKETNDKNKETAKQDAINYWNSVATVTAAAVAAAALLLSMFTSFRKPITELYKFLGKRLSLLNVRKSCRPCGN